MGPLVISKILSFYVKILKFTLHKISQILSIDVQILKCTLHKISLLGSFKFLPSAVITCHILDIVNLCPAEEFNLTSDPIGRVIAFLALGWTLGFSEEKCILHKSLFINIECISDPYRCNLVMQELGIYCKELGFCPFKRNPSSRLTFHSLSSQLLLITMTTTTIGTTIVTTIITTTTTTIITIITTTT